MSNGVIRVLFFENSAFEVRTIFKTLEGESPGQFTVINVPNYQDALTHLASANADIVLLDWTTPETRIPSTINELTSAYPEIPVIALVHPKDEDIVLEAMKFGVHDYLIKGQIDGQEVTHILKTAVARHRILCDEFCDLDVVAGTAGSPQPEETRDPEKLQDYNPNAFADMKNQYSDILENALEARAFRVDNRITKHLKGLAETLGRYRATPRDLVGLHVSALKEKTDRAPLVSVEAMVREGRWVLLQTMGYLAAYYRLACLGDNQPRASVADNLPNNCRRRS